MAKAILLQILFACALALITCPAHAQEEHEVTHAKVHFVEVEPGVKVETLNWGGTGRPVVLLAGLGGTAHKMEDFAMQLTRTYHVYGMTRRGYGASSAPIPTTVNYTAGRLAKDVLAVLDALQIKQPVLMGHSFAGEELSWIGSYMPERVAGLVYLDAGYRYALSKPGLGDFQVDLVTTRERFRVALDGITPEERKAAIDQLLVELPSFEKELRDVSAQLKDAPSMTAEAVAQDRAFRDTTEGRSEHAMMLGEQRFENIRSPILAIYAAPHAPDKDLPAEARAAFDRRDEQFVRSRAALFQALPGARVVFVPHALHRVFDSNRDQVIREIETFIGNLDAPQSNPASKSNPPSSAGI